ncbi:MAG: response regulator, partial [Candidatus Omnitrophica bacterium]|nr:response regulator [Candidatus Omnitrophota bacterium]
MEKKPEEIRVLLIEDDIGDRLAFHRQVEKQSLNYQILEASTWQDALTILQTEKTDMVLLDLNLGDIDGRHLLDKIKGVPVIVVTGGTSNQTAAEIIQIGVDDFVRKDAAGVY